MTAIPDQWIAEPGLRGVAFKTQDEYTKFMDFVSREHIPVAQVIVACRTTEECLKIHETEFESWIQGGNEDDPKFEIYKDWGV